MNGTKGLSYLGEYPLAWAACLCNETVYNLLIGEMIQSWPISYLCFCLCFKLSLYLVDDVLVADEGADPDAQDTYGNTVLHMVVIVEQLGEYPLAWAACLCNETVYNLLIGGMIQSWAYKLSLFLSLL